METLTLYEVKRMVEELLEKRDHTTYTNIQGHTKVGEQGCIKFETIDELILTEQIKNKN